MWALLINGICAVAKVFLNSDQNSNSTQTPTSSWRTFRNFICSTVSAFGSTSTTENDPLYDCVNAVLASSTRNRNNHIDHHQEQSAGISRLSRPNFRRRTHHSGGGIVRIIKPTINIHIH